MKKTLEFFGTIAATSIGTFAVVTILTAYAVKQLSEEE